MKIHTFESTGEAYDACQCDETIRNGDILLVPSEQVVGIADTWPVAVTVAYGKLHIPKEGRTLLNAFGGDIACSDAINDAKAVATERGWATRD